MDVYDYRRHRILHYNRRQYVIAHDRNTICYRAVPAKSSQISKRYATLEEFRSYYNDDVYFEDLKKKIIDNRIPISGLYHRIDDSPTRGDKKSIYGKKRDYVVESLLKTKLSELSINEGVILCEDSHDDVIKDVDVKVLERGDSIYNLSYEETDFEDSKIKHFKKKKLFGPIQNLKRAVNRRINLESQPTQSIDETSASPTSGAEMVQMVDEDLEVDMALKRLEKRVLCREILNRRVDMIDYHDELDEVIFNNKTGKLFERLVTRRRNLNKVYHFHDLQQDYGDKKHDNTIIKEDVTLTNEDVVNTIDNTQPSTILEFTRSFSNFILESDEAEEKTEIKVEKSGDWVMVGVDNELKLDESVKETDIHDTSTPIKTTIPIDEDIPIKDGNLESTSHIETEIVPSSPITPKEIAQEEAPYPIHDTEQVGIEEKYSDRIESPTVDITELEVEVAKENATSRNIIYDKINVVESPPAEVTTLSSTRRGASPPEVSPAVSSSNYLSLKSKATPRDRGGGEDITSSGGRVPGSDPRELEGEVNREASMASGRVDDNDWTSSGKEVDETSGIYPQEQISDQPELTPSPVDEVIPSSPAVDEVLTPQQHEESQPPIIADEVPQPPTEESTLHSPEQQPPIIPEESQPLITPDEPQPSPTHQEPPSPPEESQLPTTPQEPTPSQEPQPLITPEEPQPPTTPKESQPASDQTKEKKKKKKKKAKPKVEKDRPLRNVKNKILIEGFEATVYIVNADKRASSSLCKISFDYDKDLLIFNSSDKSFEMIATNLVAEDIPTLPGAPLLLKIIIDGNKSSALVVQSDNGKYLELLGDTIGRVNNNEATKPNGKVMNDTHPKVNTPPKKEIKKEEVQSNNEENKSQSTKPTLLSRVLFKKRILKK